MCLGDVLKDMIRIAVKKRDVPFERDAESIALLLSVWNHAEEHGQVDIWMLMQQSKPRHLVLDGVGLYDSEAIGH